MVEKFRKKPVQVIAVNSGNPAHEVKRYMNKVDVDVPTLVDQDRSFEEQFGFGKITLKNILQIKVFRPDGSTASLPTRNMAKHLGGKIGSPSWTVDPENVPDDLVPVCRAVEFGDFRRAAPFFQRAGNRNKHKKIINKLRSVVHQTAKRQLNRAHSLKQSGKPWESFQLFRKVTFFYRGYPNFTPPKQALQSLQNNEQVKQELKAHRALKKIRKQCAQMGVSWQHKQIKNALTMLTKKYPKTEAAKKANSLKSGN